MGSKPEKAAREKERNAPAKNEKKDSEPAKTEKNKDSEAENEGYGGIPNRNLKKNLGCG